MFRNIRDLKRRGTAVIYVSHHLPEIFEVCDRVTVLRDGRNAGAFSVAGLQESQLVKSMVGRELVNMYGKRDIPVGEEYFRVEDAGRKNSFSGISFFLKRGEILGFAGLIGSGRTELARALFGVEPLDCGTIALDGKTIRIKSSGDAIRYRLGYITEDRKSEGLFLGMSIKDNCIAPNLKGFAFKNGFMNENRIRMFAEENMRKFRIAAPDVNRRVVHLSGGNQQKALLSMWMGIEPEVLIVDEPTRGVDVGAKSEIYALLRTMASKGTGIIMISSDLLEILGLSDRIIVMRKGGIAGEWIRERATEENLIACAAGVDI
ncbi:sugar ABC transporter ATP-binding protein [Candidatus Sumerlaeota bacterium]|nr:sugar ABC transporter ATP-binding protein [Candidatus Sumerlaeota bacterium]